MSKYNFYTKEEKAKIEEVAKQYIGIAVGREVITLLHDELEQDAISKGLEAHSRTALEVKFYQIRKKLDQGHNLPEIKVISPTHSDQFCECLKQMKEVHLALKEENVNLKKEIKEVKEQLRSLRDIRQAVENYQKKI